jgi:hypothetical protein
MQFIKSKFPDLDEVLFVKEALEFVPKKKVMKEVPDEERCVATKKNGERCTKKHTSDSLRCKIHENVIVKPVDIPMKKEQCCATTKKGEQCKKKASTNGLCSIHWKNPSLVEATPQPVLVV